MFVFRDSAFPSISATFGDLNFAGRIDYLKRSCVRPCDMAEMEEKLKTIPEI